MWNHVWACYNMSKKYASENGFVYDYHVRSRPDIICMENVKFDMLPPLDKNILIGFGGTLGYPDDQFAIGGEGEAWDHYCDIEKTVIHSMWCHEMVKYTIDVYPVVGRIQVARIVYRSPANAGTPVTWNLDDESYVTMYKK
jgi:hypothetical protein